MVFLQNKNFFQVNIYNYSDYESILKSDLILFNGFFPDLGRKILAYGKEIYFLSSYNLNIAKAYFPGKEKCLKLIQKFDRPTDKKTNIIENIVYEGHTNFFSGIDISIKLMNRLSDYNPNLNLFLVPHIEPGLRAPVQFTADFDYHLHGQVISWEEFYTNIINSFLGQVSSSPEVFDSLEPEKTLILNCSNSYHQSFFDNSLKHIIKGADFYGSTRNPYADYLGGDGIHMYESSLLRNWSPFHQKSFLNRLIEERLFNHLIKRINFV